MKVIEMEYMSNKNNNNNDSNNEDFTKTRVQQWF